MRFHVVGLPHTKVTKTFGACAFTQKVRKFANMMMKRGHEVVVYGAGLNTDAQCTEFVSCTTEKDRKAIVENLPHYTNASFDFSLPHWWAFNENVIRGLKTRLRQHDFICVIGGIAHMPIAQAYPHHMTVEFGVGYHGTFAPYRVWESYAHMHAVYAASAASSDIDGQWFDAVIPNSFEVKDFPYSAVKDDYLLFVGRLIDRKGIQIAVDVARAANRRLIVAGPGNPPTGVEYAGVLDAKKRGKLMSKAHAVLAPTIYVEPFGGVAVEAMMCGTPVITTDWGAFTETVIQGVTGYRCRSLDQFVEATHLVGGLEPKAIREYAESRYSTDVVAIQYEEYFQRLMTLWGNGWYTICLGNPGSVMPDVGVEDGELSDDLTDAEAA